MSDHTDYTVRSVERALEILQSFDDEHPERGISEISEAVGLHKATIHRILTTMLNMGFIDRSSDGQKYRLGIQMIDMGFKVLRRMDLRREALPYMNKLVKEWDEAVDLSIFQNKEVLYIEVLQSHHVLTISAAVGKRFPAHCTASGKLYLAFLPEKELTSILGIPLKRYAKNTILSYDQLLKELAKIRERGYSTDDEEFEDGTRAVAAPIRNYTGDVISVLSVPGPVGRMSTERIEQISKVLCQYTADISRRLGWDGVD